MGLKLAILLPQSLLHLISAILCEKQLQEERTLHTLWKPIAELRSNTHGPVITTNHYNPKMAGWRGSSVKHLSCQRQEWRQTCCGIYLCGETGRGHGNPHPLSNTKTSPTVCQGRNWELHHSAQHNCFRNSLQRAAGPNLTLQA